MTKPRKIDSRVWKIFVNNADPEQTRTSNEGAKHIGSTITSSSEGQDTPSMIQNLFSRENGGVVWEKRVEQKKWGRLLLKSQNRLEGRWYWLLYLADKDEDVRPSCLYKSWFGCDNVIFGTSIWFQNFKLILQLYLKVGCREWWCNICWICWWRTAPDLAWFLCFLFLGIVSRYNLNFTSKNWKWKQKK